MPIPPKAPSSSPTSADLIVGSASVGGGLIVVVATATPGTLVHTVPLSGLEFQRIVIYATNSDTVNRDLTIEWGAAGAANQSTITLGAKRGFVVVVPDFKLQKGLVVRAFASAASVIRLYVSVGEITKGPSSADANGP
jgi:hypothetical protein